VLLHLALVDELVEACLVSLFNVKGARSHCVFSSTLTNSVQSPGRLRRKPSLLNEYSSPLRRCLWSAMHRCRRYVYSRLAKQRTKAARTWSGRKASAQTTVISGAQRACDTRGQPAQRRMTSASWPLSSQTAQALRSSIACDCSRWPSTSWLVLELGIGGRGMPGITVDAARVDCA
jgi:hypothetical protein